VTENCACGATDPESQVRVSDVDVCATTSVLVHVTVEPTGTLKSSGLKARLPRVSAPMGIETDVDGPPVGLGDGDGDGDGTGEGAEAEYPPHAPVISTNADTSTRRDENMKTSVFYKYRQTQRNHFGELDDLQPSELSPPARYRRAAYPRNAFRAKPPRGAR